MAVPAYTTDLITLAIGSITVDAGTWDESSDAGWDTAGAMVDDANLYYNGVKCVSAQYTKDGSGSGTTGPGTIMYDHTSSVAIPADGAAIIHHLWAAPPALNTLAGGGIKFLVGNNIGDFWAWNVSGSDFAPAPRGGWATYALNPAIGSPDDVVGTTPASPFSCFGMAVGATAQARGNPNAVNAIRYGRCESRFTGGETADYATFAGYGAVDSTSTNKWSLIDPVEGGFKFQGLMSLGLSGTAVDFRDSNVNINIADTIAVTSAFNRIEVHNSGSNVEWTAVNITALGTTSKGQFEVVDNATVVKTTCVFTDMDTFIYQSNSTIATSTHRRCGQVTQGGATMSGGLIDNSTAAIALVVADAVASVTDYSFISDGTGYALEGFSTAQSYTLSGLDFSGYAATDGSTGNEAIHVLATSGTVTLNYTGAAPSVHSAGATIVKVNSVDFTLTNVISGSTFTADGVFTTDTPAAAYNGTGDSIIQFIGAIPASFATAGDVRLFNGTYYETYAYTGVSGAQLTGVTPTLSQDFDGVKSLLEMVAPTTITTDPYTVGVQGSQQFEAMLANQATTRYIPIQFSDTTGTGFARRISQIEE